MIKNIIYILILILLAVVVYFGFVKGDTVVEKNILSFEDCVEAGFPVMESYPRQCKTDDGRTYAEEIVLPITYNNSSEDLIKVELPFPDAVVGKEFKVIGQARGGWFFEADFPIEVLDKDGNVLATGIAQAEGEWMTSEFVPFSADIQIPETYIGSATLVLKKDNPSDIRENDASIAFPINIEF